MMDFLRRHMRTIFLITITGFLAGTFIGFGSYFFGADDQDTVAHINNAKIPYRVFTKRLSRAMETARERKIEITDEIMRQLRQEVLNSLIQEEIFWQEARAYGISVSDAELAADIGGYAGFATDGRFDRMKYFQTLAGMRMTAKEFERSTARQKTIFKLREIIYTSLTASRPEATAGAAAMKPGSTQTEQLAAASQSKAGELMQSWYSELNRTYKVNVNQKLINQQ